MRSAYHRQAKALPPLDHNRKFITDPLERATILRVALLARHQQSDDIPPCVTHEPYKGCTCNIPHAEDI